MERELSGLEAAMYLRKSRAEDGMDTEEILRRHRETLTEYAARNGIHVLETFQEIKSGESLYARPEMMRMLELVEAGRFQAVLCMDIDRLSRGETRERGILWATFKRTGTLIVTPAKTYDLSEESDELMTELRGLFANFELKKIKERTQRGIFRAAKEGCYLASAPYGYRKRLIGRKHTLEIYEPEARFVRMAFEMYASGIGAHTIAKRINELGAHPRWADAFSHATVLRMLKNPVYVGRIVYNVEQWIHEDGKTRTIPHPESEWIVADGLHPPIVDVETWEKCRAILKNRWRPAYFDGSVKAPLAGLVRCRQCGGRMHRGASGGRYYLRCPKYGCSVLARYEEVEQAVISSLQDILFNLEVKPREISTEKLEQLEMHLSTTRESLAAEKRKKTRLYDFLESGTYTEAVFRERMDAVNEKISMLEERETEELREIDALKSVDISRQIEELHMLLEQYKGADAPGRNVLLCSVVDVIWYDRPTRKVPFALEIFLK